MVMPSVASSRIRINPAEPRRSLNYQPPRSGSTALVAASDLGVGHQAHLQQALTRAGEPPKIVSWCCHGVRSPWLCVSVVASVPRPGRQIKYAERSICLENKLTTRYNGNEMLYPPQPTPCWIIVPHII